MQPSDLVVKGGEVFTPAGLVKANLVVRDEKIAAITSHQEDAGEVKETIDAEGTIILPGTIDTHAHFREPGFTHKEDIETGTKAAAAGGVTFAVDMPNTWPTTNSPKGFEEHRKLAEGKAVIDFNHWPGPPANLEDISDLMDLGAIGVKVFMMKDTKRGCRGNLCRSSSQSGVM